MSAPKEFISPEELARHVILPSNGGYSITESAKAIFPRLAQAGWVRRGEAPAKIEAGREALEIKLVQPEAFRSDIEKLGPLVARRQSGSVSRDICSLDNAKALLASEEAKKHLPPVVGLFRCPLIVRDAGSADGARILSQGNHPEFGGGTVVLGGGADEISLSDAVDGILYLLREFQYVSPSDKARQIAALLSPALKFGGWIPGNRVPVPLNEADDSQAGKGLAQGVLAAIYNDKPVALSQQRGGVGSFDEKLAVALISGRCFLQLDNLRGRLDSPFFESMLTAEVVPARGPRGKYVDIDPRATFTMATSNGVAMTPDLANRSLVIRTFKRAGFEFHRYAEGGLVEHVQANQARFLGCVFAVVKEWARRGCPRSESTEHDFRPWVQSLDWILEHLFEMPRMMDGHDAAKARTASPALSFLRELGLALERAGRLGETLQTSDLVDAAFEHSVTMPWVKAGGDDDEKALARQLGVRLKSEFDRAGGALELDGIRVTRAQENVMRTGERAGEVRPGVVYTFERR